MTFPFIKLLSFLWTDKLLTCLMYPSSLITYYRHSSNERNRLHIPHVKLRGHLFILIIHDKMDATTKCKHEIINEIVIKVYFCPFELPVHKNLSISIYLWISTFCIVSKKKNVIKRREISDGRSTYWYEITMIG